MTQNRNGRTVLDKKELKGKRIKKRTAENRLLSREVNECS